jgi:hypothetical protein
MTFVGMGMDGDWEDSLLPTLSFAGMVSNLYVFAGELLYACLQLSGMKTRRWMGPPS